MNINKCWRDSSCRLCIDEVRLSCFESLGRHKGKSWHFHRVYLARIYEFSIYLKCCSNRILYVNNKICTCRDASCLVFPAPHFEGYKKHLLRIRDNTEEEEKHWKRKRNHWKRKRNHWKGGRNHWKGRETLKKEETRWKTKRNVEKQKKTLKKEEKTLKKDDKLAEMHKSQVEPMPISCPKNDDFWCFSLHTFCTYIPPANMLVPTSNINLRYKNSKIHAQTKKSGETRVKNAMRLNLKFCYFHNLFIFHCSSMVSLQF